MGLRKRLGAAAVLLACLLLTACAGLDLAALGGRNVEELLRAPRSSERQNAVLTALNEYLGEALQLKYPRGGGEPNPVLFADLDGDGAGEAAILYTAPSKGQNVHLAVLEQSEGAWRVAYEVMGLSTEVAEVELAEVFPGSLQLLVGFANASLTDKYLEVYDYREQTVYTACRQPYDVYWLGARGGEMQLAIAGCAQQPGSASMQLFAPEGRAMTPVSAAQLDAGFERCTGLYHSGSGASEGFVVDGLTAEGAQSQFMCFSPEGLVPCLEADTGDFVTCARPRALAQLTPQAFSGAGEVLAPHVERRIPTLRSADHFYEVAWMNALRARPMRRYGIWDAAHGFFVRLPDDWRGAFALTEQSDSVWQLRRREDNALLCEVTVSPDTLLPEGSVSAGRTAAGYILLRPGSACSELEKSILQNGVYIPK